MSTREPRRIGGSSRVTGPRLPAKEEDNAHLTYEPVTRAPTDGPRPRRCAPVTPRHGPHVVNYRERETGATHEWWCHRHQRRLVLLAQRHHLQWARRLGGQIRRHEQQPIGL